MRAKIFNIFIILVAILIPIIILGSVIMTNIYKVNITNESPKIYLALGPNYVNYSNIISVINSTNNGIISQTIYINNITSSNSLQMLNVLEVYNKSGWDLNSAPVYVYIHVVNLNHISLGVSQTQVTSFSNSVNVTNSFNLHILNPGPVLYLSFYIWGYNYTLSNCGTIYLSYYIT